MKRNYKIDEMFDDRDYDYDEEYDYKKQREKEKARKKSLRISQKNYIDDYVED